MPCDVCSTAILDADPHHPTSTTAPEIDVAADPVLVEILSGFKEFLRDADDDGASQDLIEIAARASKLQVFFSKLC